MNRRVALLVGLVLMVAIQSVAECAVETDLTWREKRAERRLREDVLDAKRLVDIGVVIKVVVRDDKGAALMPGRPDLKLRVVRELGPYGGVVDTSLEPPQYHSGTRDPVVWFCSEDQAACLEHDDPDVPGQLIYGSEGSGKTKLLAMLHYLWWIDLIGDPLHIYWGQTAPTKRRLDHVLNAIRELFPSRWFKYHKHDRVLTFCTGHSIRFLSAKKQSEAEGSDGQGWNQSRRASDELQDQVAFDADMESRGRSAPIDPRNDKIHYRQAATCTAKPSPEFRDLVALKLGSGLWMKRTLLIARSPFIDPSFLELVKRVMTEREFRRRYLCEDLPSEKLVYFNWSRERNLKPIPPTARRITSYILRKKTRNPRHAWLAGNDPGVSKAATIFLDAYECGCAKRCVCGLRQLNDYAWWVRGEIFTMNETTEQHAVRVLREAQRRGYNVRRGEEIVHVRSHPYGQSDSKPTKNVYRIFARVGLDAKAAQFKNDGTGTGLIAKEDRFEMMNTLLIDAAGRSRLFVESDHQGQPVAPRLVEGFETMERDEEGKGETEKKDAQDKSDPPAACGYALWNWEREVAQLARAFAAAQAARKKAA